MSFSHEDRLPSLNALRAFAVTGRHLSFTRAAEELHVTQGAVSRLVKQLEADLGCALFRRGPRGLELTGDGAAYLPALSDARSEEHTSGLQSLMRNSYAVFCLKKKIHYHTSTPRTI